MLRSLLGIGTALLDLLALLSAAVRPAHRDRLLARAVAAECGRIGRPCGPAPVGRTVAFLALRVLTGTVGGAVLLFGLALGLLYLAWLVPLLLRGTEAGSLLAGVGLGVAALVVARQVGVVLLEADRRLARALLGPDPEDALRRRVTELAISRAGVVDAVDDERRRIERDLHDGVQQRLVALGLLLGRTRRAADPDRSAALLAEAHAEAAGVLADLREAVWRVYPASLDSDGLVAAVRTLAERGPVPVSVRVEVAAEPPPPVARAAYFTVSEALANVAKHASASRADVRLEGRDGRLRVRVTDDGRGGADPAGGGLSGLARRVGAVDGVLTVRSPPGGPTEIVAELPCG